MVADLIDPPFIIPTALLTTNTPAAEMEEDEDLLADPGDLNVTSPIVISQVI